MRPEDVHATHDVREEGWLVSDPACQICRIGVNDGRAFLLRQECAGEPVSAVGYTLEELDDALAETVGPAAWAAYQGPGFYRVVVLSRAAEQRFWKQMPEDRNSAVMRAAYADLSKDGCLRPVGGFGEDGG